MKRIVFLFILIVSTLFSCNQEEKIPNDVFGTTKMQHIMWDLMLADRHAWLTLHKDSIKPDAKLKTFKMYEDVFKIHKTNADQFLRSYKFYLTRPDLTKIIFDSMSNKANRSRSSMTGDFKVKQ